MTVAKRTRMPVYLDQRAKAIVMLATNEREVVVPVEGKDPAAIEWGRLGGTNGPNSRAAMLSQSQRSDTARHVASDG